MASRKIFNYQSVILNELTEEKEGFDPSKIGHQKKHIWATCRFCGEPVRLIGSNYKKAGSACHKECRFKEQSLSGSPFNDPEVRKKAAETNKKRYGFEHACQNKIISNRISTTKKTDASKNKTIQTNIDKYGVENVFQSEEVKEKIKETNFKRYGVSHPMQSDEVKEKTKQTIKKKYGVDNLMYCDEIKDKVAQTNMDRYGSKSPMQNKDVQEKVRLTCQKRYDVDYPIQNPEIKEKIRITNLKRYKSEYPSQNKIIQNKAREKFSASVSEDLNDNFRQINILRSDDFWEEMAKENTSLTDVCLKFGLNAGGVRFHLVQDEFRERYYSTYSFPKIQLQKKVRDIIDPMGAFSVLNNRTSIHPLELDIFFPKQKFAIEFNGDYWHSEVVLSPVQARNKHKNKTNLCGEKGIRLIHIFQHQWEKRQQQFLGFIKSALGLNNTKIMARKCSIDNEPCSSFYDANHIQGYGRGTIKFFNLVYNEQIVASMSASRHHRQNNDKRDIVLNRLCFADNTSVAGGASKLFKAFCIWAKEQGYNRVISWSDNCWTEGKIYRILGFSLDREYGPDYFYYDTKKRIYRSKQSQRKTATKCPEDIKEREWAIQRGLYRIWDCGKKRWIFNLKVSDKKG